MARRRSQSPKTLNDLFYTDVHHAEDTEWFKARPDRNFRAHVWIGANVKGRLHYGRVLIDNVPRPLKPGDLPTDLTTSMIPEGTSPRLLGLTIVRRIDVQVLAQNDEGMTAQYDLGSYEKLKPGSAALSPPNVVGVQGKRPTLHPYTVTHPDPAVVLKDVIQLIQARDEEAYLYEYWMALDKDARARAG
jgi:hypothetical protein